MICVVMSDQQPRVTLVCIRSKLHQSLPWGHSSVLGRSVHVSKVSAQWLGAVGSYARIVNYEFNIRRNQLALDRRQVRTNDSSFWELIPKIDSPVARACGYIKDLARRVFVIKGCKATSAVQ